MAVHVDPCHLFSRPARMTVPAPPPKGHQVMCLTNFLSSSCCRTAMGVGQRALSLRSHGRGTPPPPGPGEGDVTPPYSWSIANTTATSLLRGKGGFNHLRESLNPSLHTGGPRRGRSFRHRLRQWCWWHGYWSLERTSYVYVVASEYVAARLRRHWGRISYPPGVWLR